MTEEKKKFKEKTTLSYEKQAERLLYARQGLCVRIEALEEKLALLRALRTREEEAAPSMKLEVQNEENLLCLLPAAEDDVYGMIYKTKCALARDRLAVRQIDTAVCCLENDPYYAIIKLKYENGLPEEEIAYQIHCDPSTVRRNKKRLLGKLAVILFGIDVLETA